MSNKDNLPVKYEEAGKPKVKEQVTQRVEQIEVFDGFDISVAGLAKLLFYIIVAAQAIIALLKWLPRDISRTVFVYAVITAVVYGVFKSGDHLLKAKSGDTVSRIFQILCSVSIGSASLLFIAAVVLTSLGMSPPSEFVWILLLFWCLYVFLRGISSRIKTRTEEHVVAEERGDQL